jgi:hypothetical protein
LPFGYQETIPQDNPYSGQDGPSEKDGGINNIGRHSG